MSANLLIVSATEFEILPLLRHLESTYKFEDGVFRNKGFDVRVLITGVGMVHMTYALTGSLSIDRHYNLIINAGVGGSFDRDIALGAVVNITHDTFADMGVTEADGSFTSAFDMKFINGDIAPYRDGWLVNQAEDMQFLPAKKSVTVNNVTGTTGQADLLIEKFNPDIESMEGAAFAFVCSLFKARYLQIRAVSNYVEPRDRSNWEIDLAIENLNATLISMLAMLND